jgi:hypothetical protein
MPSPHPAVTPAAIAIAKKYGKSVSKGIVEMDIEICVLQYAVKAREQEIARMKKTFDKYHLV